MTGLLTDVLHDRADHLDAPDLDAAEITREGDRRVRRRRTALVGSLAAAAAVAAVVLPSLLSGGGSPSRDVVADGTAAEPQQLAWVTGSTLHRTGQPDVDLGVDVRAWVWVGDDVAFTDAEHRVRIWTGDTLEVIGRTRGVQAEQTELVSDGTLVGWLDGARGLTVYDVATGEATSAQVVAGHPARVTALDGRTVYGTDARGTLAFTVGTSEVEVIDDGVGAVLDAEAGTQVRQVDGSRAIITRDGQVVQLSTREFANLSPDAALLTIDHDDLGEVVDAVTGDVLPFEHGHEWALGYQWLDQTTLAVVAFDGLDDDAETAWLLTCDGRTGVCDGPGTEVPSGYGAFQLPIGIHVG